MSIGNNFIPAGLVRNMNLVFSFISMLRGFAPLVPGTTIGCGLTCLFNVIGFDGSPPVLSVSKEFEIGTLQRCSLFNFPLRSA